MQSNEFVSHTARLRELGGQRVWSLMISLFGDLAQGEGDVIDGPVLTAIMQLLQVKPEATRVALHRLRNDGWISSEKRGRISQHSLTPKGRAESVAASPRIYAQPCHDEDDWQLILLEAAAADSQIKMAAFGFTSLTKRIYLGHSGTPAPAHVLRLSGDSVPAWLPKQLEPEGLRNEYSALLEILSDLKVVVQGHLAPLETAVLRCLIVHNWRRLVLKHPSLPNRLVSPDWPGLPCHRLVTELLEQFPRPALRDIGADQSDA